MTTQPADLISKRDLFYQELKKVLLNLYDPTVLNNSLILDWVVLENKMRSSFILQDLIIQSIEALKPNIKIPTGTKSRRSYQILRQRYVEQLNQEEVAANLSISTRQVQREEKIARVVLLDFLWTRFHLDDKPVPGALVSFQQPNPPGLLEVENPQDSIRQELLRLTGSISKTQINLAQEILKVLNTLEPFAQRMEVEIKLELSALLPPVHAPEPVLHQALTHLLMHTVQVGAGSPVLINSSQNAEEVTVTIRGMNTLLEWNADLQASVDLAADMFRLCNGVMQRLDNAGVERCFEINVSFQAEKQLPILILDDNVDALNLFQRYLAGSVYLPTLIQAPNKAVEIAVQLEPKVIIIDVMMPDQDGWMVLSQLRKHPETGQIPVIVSTILPQHDLAFTLGVDDFLQKPFNQTQLLEALNKLVNPGVQGPG
jgi:CheY-like chemotaxis protein